MQMFNCGKVSWNPKRLYFFFFCTSTNNILELCFQVFMCKQMTWRSPYNADSDLEGLGWGCISNKLLVDRDTAGPRITFWIARYIARYKMCVSLHACPPKCVLNALIFAILRGESCSLRWELLLKLIYISLIITIVEHLLFL